MAAGIMRGAAVLANGAKGGGGFFGGIAKGFKNIVGEFGKSILTGLGFSAGDKLLTTGIDAATSGIKKISGQDQDQGEQEMVTKTHQKNTSRSRKVAQEYTDTVDNHLPSGIRGNVSNKKRKKVVEPPEEEYDEDNNEDE
jgi:hypothetical protein